MELSKDPREWFDWQRVLLAWRYRYSRTGLTPHCVATLCGRPPEDILSEMMDDGSVHPQYCGTIIAPIVSMSTIQPRTLTVFMPSAAAFERRLYSYSDNGQPETWSEMEDRLLTKYPWPKYKSIGHMQGRVTTGLEQTEFMLSQIALGKTIPYRSDFFNALMKEDDQ